jgi:hypothetical protein
METPKESVDGRFLRAWEAAVFGESRVERVLASTVSFTPRGGLNGGGEVGSLRSCFLGSANGRIHQAESCVASPLGEEDNRVSASTAGTKLACYSRSTSRKADRRLFDGVVFSFGTSVSESRRSSRRGDQKGESLMLGS